ncbi:trans-aconitate 2-methyltransferase [Methylocapsa sp. S129]|uniref:trans-aconitate 2-methyltransferase n=1 Tax=Methylocapsa sp. S129 TaxID=1641869 RepID=UPI00131DB0EE|nr:trans-aconitate 2-methyltransferase [Methylocapsa sp. S129]
MEDWSARQYLQFEAERTRPAFDLLARVANHAAERIVDLGCGPGNSTELLAKRFPRADILGLDTSDDMLTKARARLPRVTFEKADVAHWRGAEPLDLIYANAVLQWIPGHIDLMVRLTSQLAPGGSLAVQMPDNFDEPSHVLMRKVAARAPFRDKLGGASAARETIGAFADYYAALAPHCADVDVWRTTYVHPLRGPDAIVEWVKGTGLRPFLDPLSPDERQAFLVQYRDEIAMAYPTLADGRALLPFPRLFIVAVRGDAARTHG